MGLKPPKGLKKCFRAFYNEITNRDVFSSGTVRDHYFEKRLFPDKVNVCVRHDVDIAIDLVLPLAEYEASWGISASYYFLTDTAPYRIWQSDIPRKLVELGHEVGLHSDHFYEQLALNRDGLARLREDIRKLSELCGKNISGVVWHGGKHLTPFKIRNYDLYKDIAPQSLNLDYHDAALYIPNTMKWAANELISDGENNLRFIPGKVRKTVKKMLPGQQLLFIGHPFMMFEQGFQHRMDYPNYPYLSPPNKRNFVMDLKSLVAYNKEYLGEKRTEKIKTLINWLEKTKIRYKCTQK